MMGYVKSFIKGWVALTPDLGVHEGKVEEAARRRPVLREVLQDNNAVVGTVESTY